MFTPKFKQFFPAIAWFVIVMILICMPGQDYPDTNGWSDFLKKIWFDKWVHAGMFGGLFFLSAYPFIKSNFPQKLRMYWGLAIFSSIWGLTTEFIQLYVPGRDFDLLDWAADSFGVLIGFIVILRLNRNSNQEG